MRENCKELYILRHGQSTWNAERRHQGQRDTRLTPLGRAQAEAMGAVLAGALAGRAGLVALASPLARAAETARIALAPLGLAARPEPRLMEIGLGAWEGLTDAEIFARWPEAEAPRRADPFGWHFTAPGGERYPALAARLGAVLDEIAGPAVIVGHATALRVLRGLCLGLDRAGMAALPGGQGSVWRIRDGRHEVLG